MAKFEKCPHCDSSEVTSDIRLLDQTYPMDLVPDWKPLQGGIRTKRKGFFGKSLKRFPIKACCCLSCGHLELFVSDPSALKEQVEKKSETSRGQGRGNSPDA